MRGDGRGDGKGGGGGGGAGGRKEGGVGKGKILKKRDKGNIL